MLSRHIRGQAGAARAEPRRTVDSCRGQIEIKVRTTAVKGVLWEFDVTYLDTLGIWEGVYCSRVMRCLEMPRA
jgi:hypothetical protein